MMRFNTALFALGIACCAAQGPAAPKRDEPGYQPSAPTIVASPLALAIAAFDRDGDMIVSRAEYDAGVARSFAFADQDANVRLGLIELSAWAQATLGNSGALPGQFDFDRDGDDSISRNEFTALFGDRFVALDKDKDHALRRSELVSFTASPDPDRRRRDTSR